MHAVSDNVSVFAGPQRRCKPFCKLRAIVGMAANVLENGCIERFIIASIERLALFVRFCDEVIKRGYYSVLQDPYSAACGSSSLRSHLSLGVRAARVSSRRRRGARVGAAVKRAALPALASV